MTGTYLARQLLLSREKLSVVAAVERLVGMQAQLAKPPYLGLWTRVQGVTRAKVNELFLTKQLVRGTAMRGTLHVMTAADFLGLRMTLQPGLDAGMKSILREKADLPLAALHAFAREKFPCTMDALRDSLAVAFPRFDKRAMAYAVRCTLPIVQVPDAAERFAFSSAGVFQAADTWLGRSFAAADPAALVRRYLRGYGPATIKDAQTWAGTDLREGFAGLKADGTYFDLPRMPVGDAAAPPRLIPAFDNLVLAHHDRDRIIDQAHRAKVTSKNLQVAATFLVGGRVAGTWKYEKGKLALSPFVKVAKAEVASLEAEAAAAADLL